MWSAKTVRRSAIALALVAFASAGTVMAQPTVPALRAQHATGASSALYATHAPGDYSRLFLVRQNGEIWIVRLPSMTVDTEPYLIVPDVRTSAESGLLGLAFHPNYAANGYLYVFFNRSPTSSSIVMRFTRSAENPDLVDVDSAYSILTVSATGGIHHGGWIGFGPDGMLYITAGDHGSSSNARDLTDNLKGKLLRIDVNGDDFPASTTRNYRIPPDNPYVGIEGDDEIYASGFRNPWRACIEAGTGDMYIGDVGSGREELNFLPYHAAGLDFGWPCQEGANNNCAASIDVALPFGHYRSPPAPPLNISGNAVIGGDVYHGCAIPSLDGRYFFGDLSGDKVSLRYDGVAVSDVRRHTAELSSASPHGFGRDAYGELYICGPQRTSKIVPASPIGRDCNANSIPDRCDVLSGHSADANHDGVPDECPPPGDLDNDGVISLSDLARLLTTFGSCAGSSTYDAAADFNGDACVDLVDLATLLSNYAGG